MPSVGARGSCCFGTFLALITASAALTTGCEAISGINDLHLGPSDASTGASSNSDARIPSADHEVIDGKVSRPKVDGGTGGAPHHAPDGGPEPGRDSGPDGAAQPETGPPPSKVPCAPPAMAGSTCTLPQADSARCDANGICQVVACAQGFGDCTSDSGCETSLDTAQNCGACGHDCLGAACTQRLCEATQLGSFQEGTFAESIGVSGQNVYWIIGKSANGGGMFRCPISGCGTLADFSGGSDSPVSLVLDSRQVYWTDGTLGVADCALSGCAASGPAILSGPALSGSGTSSGPVGGLARDTSSNLYWADVNSQTVKAYKPSLPGSGTATLATSANFPTAIAVNGTTLYWLEIPSVGSMGVSGRVMRCATDCTNNATAFADNRPMGGSTRLAYNYNTLTVSNGTVYWMEGKDTNSPPGQIMTCPSAGCGSGPTAFDAVGDPFSGLYSDGTYLYWGSNDGAPSVVRRKLDGSAALEKFAVAGGSVTALTSDAERVYWLEMAGAGIGPFYLMSAPK